MEDIKKSINESINTVIEIQYILNSLKFELYEVSSVPAEEIFNRISNNP